jgi:hypothetical protein
LARLHPMQANIVVYNAGYHVASTSAGPRCGGCKELLERDKGKQDCFGLFQHEHVEPDRR